MARFVILVVVLVALVGGCSVDVQQPSKAMSVARYQLAGDGKSMIDVFDGTLYNSIGNAWTRVHDGPNP